MASTRRPARSPRPTSAALAELWLLAAASGSVTIWAYQLPSDCEATACSASAGPDGVAGPRDAEVTIVGGGAVGAAAAYFLAREGRADIQLLERGGLCEATSSQAAG